VEQQEQSRVRVNREELEKKSVDSRWNKRKSRGRRIQDNSVLFLGLSLDGTGWAVTGNSRYREIEKYVCVNSRTKVAEPKSRGAVLPCGEGEIHDISDFLTICFGLFLGGTGWSVTRNSGHREIEKSTVDCAGRFVG